MALEIFARTGPAQASGVHPAALRSVNPVDGEALSTMKLAGVDVRVFVGGESMEGVACGV
jgi:hypothetical protein